MKTKKYFASVVTFSILCGFSSGLLGMTGFSPEWFEERLKSDKKKFSKLKDFSLALLKKDILPENFENLEKLRIQFQGLLSLKVASSKRGCQPTNLPKDLKKEFEEFASEVEPIRSRIFKVYEEARHKRAEALKEEGKFLAGYEEI